MKSQISWKSLRDLALLPKLFLGALLAYVLFLIWKGSSNVVAWAKTLFPTNLTQSQTDKLAKESENLTYKKVPANNGWQAAPGTVIHPSLFANDPKLLHTACYILGIEFPALASPLWTFDYLMRFRIKYNGTELPSADAVVFEDRGPALEKDLAYLFAGNGYYPSLWKCWIAVARFETQNYSSQLLLDEVNPWGMKVVYTRPTTLAGKAQNATFASRGFGRYYTIFDAACDIICWMKYNSFPFAFTSFLDFVKLLKEKQFFEETVDYYYNGANNYYKNL